MTYKLADLSIVNARIAQVLHEAGIGDSEQLLMAVTLPGGMSELAASTGLDARLLGEIAERADLMRIKGIGPAYVELLQNAGVRAVRELAAHSPAELTAKLTKTATTYGISKTPKSAEVATWVANAKRRQDVQGWANQVRSDEVRSRFADEEWSEVRTAPAAVAGLVMTASTSRGNDWAAEGQAAAGVIDAAKRGTLPYSFANVAFPKGLDLDGLQIFIADTPRMAMLAAVKRAVAIVDAKAPEAAAGYRKLLLETGEAVAQAAEEGGFLGMGKKVVSKEEQATLDELKAAIS